MSKLNIYDEITNRIIEQLESRKINEIYTRYRVIRK